MKENFFWILQFYDKTLGDNLMHLLKIVEKYDKFNSRSTQVIKTINAIFHTLGALININDFAKTEEERILENSIIEDGIKPFSRTLFNLSNLNFIDCIINDENMEISYENISPFVKLGLYSLFDSKINNQVNLENLDIFNFSTLSILKNNSNEILSNEKILKKIRNGLTHDQFYIYTENEQLYLHFNNKNYFEATISLNEVFSLFDSVLDCPLKKIDFTNKEQMHILADEILLNLIFNNNKDHFLTEYKSEDYCKIDASVFSSQWIDVENRKSREFANILFLFKNDDDKKLFRFEYGNSFNVFRSSNKKLFQRKNKVIYKDYNMSYITLTIPRYLVDFELMSYDQSNNIHIPTNVLLNKLRNAVAHGHFLYDDEINSFMFYDSKGNQTPNFTTLISRENLERFLYNPLFINTLLLPEGILKIIKSHNESNDPMFSHLTESYYELNSLYNNLNKKDNATFDNIKYNIYAQSFDNYDMSNIRKYIENNTISDDYLNDDNIFNKPKF